MKTGLIVYMIALLVFYLGVSMFLPLFVALVYQDGSAFAFFVSILIACCLGGVVYLFTRGQKDFHLTHRDGLAIVTFGWIAAGFIGTLPYLLSGSIPDFTMAYFESVSGFTTTGASILNDVQHLPPAVLFWRAQTQWMGGMGIIVLSIAILPFLGIGGMELYKAETPSPVVDKLTPRISSTAKLLWKIYIFLTLFMIVLLLLGGMPLYDSICHSFAAMPTGGFSTKNASVGYYQSSYIDYVIVIFMFIAGVNFSLHYKLVSGHPKQFYRDPEFRVYLYITVIAILVVSVNIYGTIYPRIQDALRYASFQVVSIMTTTGFVTADFEKWPVFSQLILFVFMFLGGMAGSTAGGIKIMRIILLVKHCYLEIFRIIHPHATTMVKLGRTPVSQTIMRSIWGFFILYLVIFMIGAMVLAALGLDIISALTAMAACLGNVGPGLGSIGPMDNFSVIPLTGQWVLIVSMLLGRLEIYTIIVLLMPAFWRK
jgi:trk system potassium uptake protein TrkH